MLQTDGKTMSYPLSPMADRLWLYRLANRELQPLEREMPPSITNKFQPWCLDMLVFSASRGPWLVVFDPLERISNRTRVDNRLLMCLGVSFDVINLDADDMTTREPVPYQSLDPRVLAITAEVIALSQQVLCEVMMGCAEVNHVVQRIALNRMVCP